MKKKECTEETSCSKQKMKNLSKWKTQQEIKAKTGNEAGRRKKENEGSILKLVRRSRKQR